ncbi:uncharacterized protein BDR25DRAFT_305515 [Lindgomyces ingoldianus]|uniref:Uncharacterized protein n=1 Tax=Lindgomyces ingoldianus TaxID=673940 RepID=A0ACB6QKJ8_9PLEO|nr:uncharacterized protein BDR25DRAFT_305515 [Lindgomyces ingoldianus]KAF2467446.1 hypothetical protein BDR25DRAFT_305515 [Lindgomyces ingoldianus]
MDSSDHFTENSLRNEYFHRERKAPSSLASRIASSASGLARNAVGSSSAHDLPTTLSSGSGVRSKLPNGPSSSSHSHWLENLPVRSGRFGTLQPSSSHSSFRSSPTQETRNHDFEEFLSPSQATFDSGGEVLPHDPWTHQLSQDASNNWTFSGLPASQHSLQPIQSCDDGTEVRLLLSDPRYSLETDTRDIEMIDDDMEETSRGLFEVEFSAEEQRSVMHIKSVLPPAPEHRPISTDNPLSLNPHWTQVDHYQEPSASDWVDVLNGYIDNVWGPNSHAAVQLKKLRHEDLEDGIAKWSNRQLDGQALSRLKMVLGHMVEKTQIRSTIQEAQSSSQTSFDTAVRQEVGATWSTTPSFALPQTSFQPLSKDHVTKLAAQSAVYQEVMRTNEQQQTHRPQHQPLRRDSPMAEQGMDEELSRPEFHCPWIRCHQRFTNAIELHQHTTAHAQYSCPHEDCTSQFQSHQEWADHITGPHHDLLEFSIRAPIAAEG